MLPASRPKRGKADPLKGRSRTPQSVIVHFIVCSSIEGTRGIEEKRGHLNACLPRRTPLNKNEWLNSHSTVMNSFQNPESIVKRRKNANSIEVSPVSDSKKKKNPTADRCLPITFIGPRAMPISRLSAFSATFHAIRKRARSGALPRNSVHDHGEFSHH